MDEMNISRRGVLAGGVASAAIVATPGLGRKLINPDGLNR
jgi:hypothetical protein